MSTKSKSIQNKGKERKRSKGQSKNKVKQY